jgi:ribosomal protein S27E
MGFRYKLCLTVAQKGLAPERKGNRTVGIDLGWRVVALHPKHAKGVVVYGLHEPFNASSAPSEILTRGRISGIRVAYWHDERGRRGQLILPIENVELFRKPSELRSILDDKFNHVKADLDSLLKPCKDVPGWFADVIKALPQWRAPVRLYRLFRRWERERFVGDERAFAVLDAWVERFRHLRSWEDNLRDQNIANRREIYRRFAAWLADQYDVVAMEEFDLSRVARTSPAEDGTAKQNYSADNRRLVAPSSLVSIIKKTLGREGVRIIEVNAAHTTTECHECGHVETFDSAAHLVRNCSACGAVYDQDDNASINIKKRAKN